jgi:hypothetical protein
MRRQIASIVTGWGSRLGTGHIQRMGSLADYLERKKNIRVFICTDQSAEIPLPALSAKVLPYIHPGSVSIIRDKRDSSIDEMLNLKRYARVITIDDCGPGRDFADLAIDLLPNLKYSIHTKKLFIYGSGFTGSIKRLEGRIIEKTIDCAVYSGYKPPRETVDFLLSLVPSGAVCAHLCGEASVLLKNGITTPLQMSYAEALLSTKVLISHFGITLYEGHIAGCHLVSVNPTKYHSRLADNAGNEIGIINLGLREGFDLVHARDIISGLIHEPPAGKTNPAAIADLIEKGLELFYNQIAPFFDA